MLSKTVSNFYKFVSKPLITNRGPNNFAVLKCVSDPSHSFSATNANSEMLMFFQETCIQEDCILECGEMKTRLSCLCHQESIFSITIFVVPVFTPPLGFPWFSFSLSYL